VRLLKGEQFFENDFPIFLNREVESFSLPMHEHDFVEISLVEKGSGFHYVNDQIIPVQQGHLFFLPLGTAHVFRPASPNKAQPLVICNFIFRSELLVPFKHLFPEQSNLYKLLFEPHLAESRWFYLQDKHRLYARLLDQSFTEYYQRLSSYRSVLHAQLLQLLLLMEREHVSLEQNVPEVSSFTRKKVKDAIVYVHSNYSEPLTLQMLAEMTNMSPSHFQKLFKEATGQPLNQYLQFTRIQASCELLMETDLSVQEIAGRVGYADMKFFYQLFRKMTGVTPLEYRKRLDHVQLSRFS
jgi:AraC family transcriptional regulator, L-rhamnose operon transcriptional activator RhaR